jgi:hypothetical protein
VKTYATEGAAESAVTELIDLARRAAEERGVHMVIVAAGFIGDAAKECAVEVGYVGPARAALDIAANAIGAIHTRCPVDFERAGISKAMAWGFEHGDGLLRSIPPDVPIGGEA